MTQVAVYEHPWRQGGAVWVLLCGVYVVIFGVYWLGNLAHLVMDMRSLIEARTPSVVEAACFPSGEVLAASVALLNVAASAHCSSCSAPNTRGHPTSCVRNLDPKSLRVDH